MQKNLAFLYVFIISDPRAKGKDFFRNESAADKNLPSYARKFDKTMPFLQTFDGSNARGLCKRAERKPYKRYDLSQSRAY